MFKLTIIVIPGLFLALCLKYDVDNNLKKLKNLTNFSTKYFNICYVSYALGISSTFIVMNIYKKA